MAAGVTQAELARRLGISQPAVASMERESRTPNPETLQRVENALAGRPSDVLAHHQRQVLDLVVAHRGRRAFVFGSVARGEDSLASDIDLIVDFAPETSLLDHAALYGELSDLLAPYSVDLVSMAAVRSKHSGLVADMRELA